MSDRLVNVADVFEVDGSLERLRAGRCIAATCDCRAVWWVRIGINSSPLCRAHAGQVLSHYAKHGTIQWVEVHSFAEDPL